MNTDHDPGALYASLFPRAVTKAERRKIQILDGAIACLCAFGIENTTYETIAKKSKASRTLVIHYFPDRPDLMRLVFLYIRADMQNAAVERIRKAKTPEKQLTAYIESTFEWLEEKPDFWAVWMLFFYYSGIRPEFKRMHTELTTMGHDRIKALVGALPGNQALAEKELSLRAKTLQALITGALTATNSETLPMSREALAAQTIEDCLRIARGK